MEYGSFPCMLVCYSQNGRKWFRKNKDVSSKLFPNKVLDHESTAFEVLFGNKTETRREMASGDTWFNWGQANRYEVWEETVQLIENETLTLLTWKNEKMLEAAEDD